MDKPVVKFHNNVLHLLYAKVGNDYSRIIYRVSVNQGEAWSNEKILNQNISDSNSNGPLGWKADLLISSEGKVYAAWIEGRDFYSIAFTKSDNYGETFRKAELIEKANSPENCEKCFAESFSNVQLFEDSGVIYLFYIKHTQSGSDIRVVTSENKGGNWEDPINLTRDFSFMKDYSVVMDEQNFKIIAFRDDQDNKVLYYSVLPKDNLTKPQHSFLFDNDYPAKFFKDAQNNYRLLYIKNNNIDETVNLNLAQLAETSNILGDNDNDGIDDNFEQAILDKFRPTWRFQEDDPNNLPVRMANSCNPQWLLQDGTIYGEVFRHGYSIQQILFCDSIVCTGTHWMEIHFFEIWSDDHGCLGGLFCKHAWDQEHASARIIYSHNIPDCNPNWHPDNEYLWDASKWKVDLWRFFAHEGKPPCSKTETQTGLWSSGKEIWVSVKHGTYKSAASCNGNLKCCDTCWHPRAGRDPNPINVGQVGAPLNQCCWASNLIPSKMDPDIPPYPSTSTNRCNQ